LFEIGNTLREARLRRGLDFRQVEQATKIRGRYLRSLEEEDFDALPAETYVRGFLRSYAEFLGLDGQLYVDEYNSRFVTGEEQVLFRPRKSPPKRGPGRGLETNVVLLALTAIAVLTALVIAAWKFSSSPETGQPTTRSSGTANTTGNGTGAQAAPSSATLVIRAASGASWLEVHANPGGGKTGKMLYSGTLQKGQAQRFVAKKLWVNAGVPEHLVVKLNGERVTIGYDKPVAVIVTADGITSAQPQ
jgi:cytoskeletal protein RodZ